MIPFQSTNDAATQSDAPSSSHGSGIDLQQLVERCLGNLEFADRILTSFLTGLENKVRELDQAAERGDLETIRKLAHRLKGEAGNLGASAIVDLAARTETAAREGIEPAALARLRELTDACRSMRKDAFTFSSLAATTKPTPLPAAVKRTL